MELQNTVKEALNALYHHPDDAIRARADRWLQDFQRTIDAWQVTIHGLWFLIRPFPSEIEAICRRHFAVCGVLRGNFPSFLPLCLLNWSLVVACDCHLLN